MATNSDFRTAKKENPSRGFQLRVVLGNRELVLGVNDDKGGKFTLKQHVMEFSFANGLGCNKTTLVHLSISIIDIGYIIIYT